VALAPAIWPLEASNAVLVAERRQRSSADEVAWFLDSLGSLPVMIMPLAVERVWERTALLAREMNLTLYDALYLELALSEGLPLATLDQELRSAASRCGVPAYQP
jgi:predicted nucleic acid-binding protein